MSRASVLARGQAAAEAGMVDTCVIERDGTATTDPVSGDVTTPVTQLYAGKCRVQQHQATADDKDIAEDQQLLLRIEVQLPMSLTGLQAGDKVRMVTSADLDLPGRVFRIHDLAHKTEATARRVQCIERTGS